MTHHVYQKHRQVRWKKLPSEIKHSVIKQGRFEILWRVTGWGTNFFRWNSKTSSIGYCGVRTRSRKRWVHCLQSVPNLWKKIVRSSEHLINWKKSHLVKVLCKLSLTLGGFVSSIKQYLDPPEPTAVVLQKMNSRFLIYAFTVATGADEYTFFVQLC